MGLRDHQLTEGAQVVLRLRTHVKALWLAVITAVVLAADQVTKALIRGSISPGAARRVVPGVLWLVHEQNSGVAFSLLTGSEAGVIVITLAVVAGVLAFFARAKERAWLWLACGLVIGGALGNILDRTRFGYVVDFADLHFGEFRPFFIFNVGDAAISIGVVILLLRAFLAKDRPKENAEHA